MACEDCEREIAKLRAEVDILREAFEQWHGRINQALDKAVGELAAQQRSLLADIGRRQHQLLTRLESATRLPPAPEREEPPRRH